MALFEIESAIRSATEQQQTSEIFQMTPLSSPVYIFFFNNSGFRTLYHKMFSNQEYHFCLRRGLLDVQYFAMDELSMLISRPCPDEATGGHELTLFDFLELHPFVRCCAHCEKSRADLKRCSRCHTTNYCSSDCQRSDWKRHKVACIST